MPDGTFRYDQLLSNYSIGLGQGEFVAERVFPVVTVDNPTDKYPVFGPENLTPQDDLRAPGSEAKDANWSMSDDSYSCEGHALRDSVPREKSNNGIPSINLLQNSVLTLTEKVNLIQEINLVAALAAGMTGDSVADQSGDPWDDDDVDPFVIIDEQMSAIALRTGKKPNVLTISDPVMSKLKLNANVRGLITGAGSVSAAAVTPAQIAAYLGLDEVIVASAVKNSAIQGQAMTGGWVWGDYALLSVRPKVPGLRIMSLGNTFAWSKALTALAGSAGDQGALNGYQMVQRYWWQPTLSDIVEVHKHYDQKLVAKDAGCLFTNCIS
jgi:hypothetical protein